MKTKWFRVATSGKTVDGRDITPAQIDQMAESYNPATYGARIWVEHLRSFLPDSPFKAYGDVLAVKAETDADGKRVLYAQVDATQELMKMSADRQKVFWSIEMDPNFTGTGKAYMVGLAVTDSPASIGTEMLRFSLKSDSAPATAKGHLFSEPVEVPSLEADGATDDKPNLLTRVTEMLNFRKKGDDQRFAQLDQAVIAIAGEVAEIKTAIAGFAAGGKPDPQLAAKVDRLSADFAALKSKVEGTSPDPARPKSDGTGNFTTTDC